MAAESSYIVTVLSGEGSSKMIGEKAKSLGIKKALVLTDKGVFGAGIVTPLLGYLKDAEVETVLFDGVLPDPPDTLVHEVFDFFTKENADGLIAIGGGSTMDTAKAVNTLVTNEGPISKWYVPNFPSGGYTIPMIMVPTTAGTGAEATSGAVISDTETGRKKVVIMLGGYASLAIVDPLLQLNMPIQPSVYCAFDILTHAMDGICSTNPEPYAVALCEKAVRNVFRYLPKVIADPKDVKARGALSISASFGGNAINNGGGHLSHSVGHTLGAVYHVTHGLACSFAMPQWLEQYSIWFPDQGKIVAESMGVAFDESENGAEVGKKMKAAMVQFMKECKLPSMKEAGLSLDDVIEVIPLIMEDIGYEMGPKKIGVEEYTKILTEAYNNY